jgi:hypothetical protein
MLTMGSELEFNELKARVERLEAIVQRLVGQEPPATTPASGQPVAHDQLLAWLKAEGLIVEPPPMARVHGEHWRTLPEEEKQQIRRELDHLPPGPMVSEIVIESRR